MESITEAKEYVNKLVSEYKKYHIQEQERDLLIGENNIEARDIKGYHGREILELLQNADDAYQKSIELGEKPEEDLEVVISYKKNILSITNTGTYFDKAGIKAIVQGNNSPKTGKYIGSKGTGFRSILNWAKSVKILSGGFNVEFSKSIASNFYNSIKDYPQIKKQSERNKNLYIPMLAIPKNIENADFNKVTNIQIEIDEEKQNDDFSVLKQIDSIDLRSLLFLPNISKISIITDSKEIIYKRENTVINNEESFVILKKINSSTVEIEEKFHLYTKRIEKAIKEKKEDLECKDVLLSIAVPEDYNNFNTKYLYSFFPLLDTTSPFNCVMHASYVLGDHRNTIVSSDENKFVAKEQIKYLIEIARKYIADEKYDIAYNILIPLNFTKSNFKFMMPFSHFNLEEFYLDLISEEKIFRTVNDNNISVNDSPELIRNSYPDFFKGNSFDKLLIGFNETSTYEFIDLLATKKSIILNLDQMDLCEKINEASNNWSIKQRVETFIWWNESNYRNILPKLLKTQEDKYLALNDECYFLLGDFTNMVIPSWVKIPSLKKEYQDELIKQTEKLERFINFKKVDTLNPSARIISQQNIFPTVQFTYRDRSNIISAVNSSTTDYDKSIEFTKWLWTNYHSVENWMPPGRNKETSFNYNFPDKEIKSIIDSEMLYFSSDYENDLASQIFDTSYKPFPSISEMGLENIDITEFKNFFHKFGVKYFPEIKIQLIQNISQSYRKKYKGYNYVGNFYLPYINNLESILSTLSTEDVIKWIVLDTTLFANLSNNYATEGHFQAQSYPKGRYYEINERNVNILNYILEVFNETSWIDIDGKKYAPSEILQNFRNDSKNNEKLKSFLPVFSIKQIESISKNLKIDFMIIKDIFDKFSFCNDVTELKSNNFYKLMLDIQDCKNSQERIDISKVVYRAIEAKKEENITFDDSENKKIFFDRGEVLVKYKGQLQFQRANLSYVPSTKILNKNEEFIIDKSPRTGNENFKRIFNCIEYNKKYEIIPGSAKLSLANDKFQSYYKEFLKYAYAFKDSNAQIGKYIYSLSINLVKEIDVKQNDTNKIKINNLYECLRESVSSWYIIVPETDFSINDISEKIELIFSNIANTPGFESGKIGELFRAKDKEDREFLIKKEFGSLSVIDSDNYKNDIKNNFITVIKNLNNSYSITESEINFDDFFSIDNTEKIINFLKRINTDIEDFKNAGFEYTIDLIPYFKRELSDFITENKRKYKNALYILAKQNGDLQKTFIQDYYKFENFTYSEYKNSIDFDIFKIIDNEFSKVLNNPIVLNDKINCIADDEYKKNYDLLNPDNLFIDEIANNDDVKNMIYFCKTEQFKDWLNRMKNIQAKNSVSTDNPYLKYNNVIPTKKEINFHDDDKNQSDNSSSMKNHGSYTRTGKEKKERNQKILGNKGELLIYNMLCEKYGKENVYPKSEAFVDLKILKAGQASSSEYDLSFMDENNKEFFVEVKSGDANSFYISPGELKFAKSKVDKYKLFIVYNMDEETPNYIELPIKFWEDSKFRMKEIVESIYINF